jgi:hypothetical protein
MKLADYFNLLAKYLPSLIAMVEIAFTWKDKSGPEKKAAVTETLKVVANGIQAESTGGQAETWAKIAPVVDQSIETAVAIAKITGAFGPDVDENAAISMG